jgi:hypothetical protein
LLYPIDQQFAHSAMLILWLGAASILVIIWSAGPFLQGGAGVKITLPETLWVGFLHIAMILLEA